jgi:hypothetical protein
MSHYIDDNVPVLVSAHPQNLTIVIFWFCHGFKGAVNYNTDFFFLHMCKLSKWEHYGCQETVKSRYQRKKQIVDLFVDN